MSIFWMSLMMGSLRLSLTSEPPEVSPLRINELMSSNIHVRINPYFSDFTDWIELYNPGEIPVELEGLFITDDFSNPHKWPLPMGAVIEPKSCFIIWADGSGHGDFASFKLSKQGEQVGIFGTDGRVIDSVTFPLQLDDVSYGRFPDGGNQWHYFSDPTCGASNQMAGLTGNMQASSCLATPVGGIYSGTQLVTIRSATGASIRYTLDGSLPTLKSNLYKEPIAVDTSMVVRARAFLENLLPGDVITQTYIVNEPFTLPVISLTTPPEFLFSDEIGITVGIPVSDSLDVPPPFDPDANFWKDWERPVHIEYFETDGDLGFSQDAGIKIFGGAFGRQVRQKAFTLLARDKYGDPDFDYRLFSTRDIDTYKRFVLRCSSNDFNKTYLRDAMMNSLVINQMDLDYQAYEPALVYINGVFWGLYNLREKMNQFYPESNYGIDADQVDLMEGYNSTAYGDGVHYLNLLQFVQTHDMSVPENYEYVQTLMDVIEFMNYYITQIYVNNQDWLYQNIKCWREHSPSGKWRWMLYDMDWGFGGQDAGIPEPYNANTIDWVMKLENVATLFQGLILNENFKNEFVQRFATHLNLSFSPQRVVLVIDSLALRIAPEMPRQIERWGAIRSLSYWNDQLDRLREFALERPHFVFKNLEETLDLNELTPLVLEVSDSAAGRISIQDVPVREPFFSGSWFTHIPLRVRARARPGWRFVRWDGDFPSLEENQTVTLTRPSIMLAIFEPFDPPSLEISEIHYNPSSSLQGDDEVYEFLEMVNSGENEEDVSGYHFTDGIEFAFPVGSTIKAGEYVVIAQSAEAYANSGFQVFQILGGKLNNAGEILSFSGPQGGLVDFVHYLDCSPWPVQADGAGPSLELIDPSLDNSISDSWKASQATGGTPGRASFTGIGVSPSHPSAHLLIQSWPNPFHELTTFRVIVAGDCKVTLRILNIMGQEVGRLTDQFPLPGEYKIDWSPGRLPAGSYVALISDGKQMAHCKVLLY